MVPMVITHIYIYIIGVFHEPHLPQVSIPRCSDLPTSKFRGALLSVSRENTFDNLYGDTKPTKVVSQMLSGTCHSYFFWGVTFGLQKPAAILRDAARNLQITVAYCSHWHHTTTHNWSITHGCMKTASCWTFIRAAVLLNPLKSNVDMVQSRRHC